MKKLTYLLSVLSLLFTIFSCDQEINYPYEGKDRIHFKHFDIVSNKRVYIDSTVFSFGLKDDTIRIDTLKLVVELVGKPLTTDRKYRVEILTDSTTAEEGLHYEKFSTEQIFRAKRIRDTLKIILFRDNLSSDYTKPSNKRLDLILRETADFDIGLTKGKIVKVLLNDYLSEPKWWKENFGTSLGYFHPKKWRILISFNKEFANEKTCPFHQNNEGRSYIDGLVMYFNRNTVYDYIDGKKYKLEMYSMKLVEE